MDKDTRNRIATFMVVGIFTVLFLRVFWLQIVCGERYERLSMENCVRQVEVRAPRGLIYDCRKTSLADTKPSYTLYLPGEQRFSYLEDTLNLKFKELDDTKLVRDIPFNLVCMIEERRTEMPGVSLVAEPVRRTYSADTICHIMGYVGQISKEELKTTEGYKPGDIIGKTGIEKEYEKYLRGQDGLNYIEVDASGKEVGIFSPGRQPTPGNNVYLSIDMELQKLCAKSLSGYQSGALVAVNPQNGRVLAYYSRPGFDPNKFSPCIDEDAWRELSRDPNFPLFDRAGKGRFPPASVFKLVVTAAGIEKDLVTEHTHMKLPCKKGVPIGNKFYECWKEHGSLNLLDAVIQSCDAYFYQLGMELGIENIATYSKIFELDKKTGIDLPDEGEGLIPDEEWYNSHYGKNGWSRGIAANLSIGQGEILLTPLRIAILISTIANGGTIYPPTLVDSIVSYGGKRVFTNTHPGKKVNLNENTIAFLRKAMLEVVENPDGTGRAAGIQGVEIAGKTGTAQNPRGEDHAWFVCFAPYNNPTIALVVFVENAGMGGEVATPIARKILEYVFRERE
ncbi:penicillin-binding protein 2 [candidate division WOR-3 bacterium JGI_Cruoil_03_44_89]|uniref:Penicillin-binding protein 2 n=1 Tax=candidate division WOR-3 bacterium JGI_Cruoil_03_44_89 TaxID=1973748 RepID=A0A235BPU9_UNCW3|nr:MAG: penicillin-binding protein 2 [candidate division WOR-3 bacterium JGI_Cruoil_03_44_89]